MLGTPILLPMSLVTLDNIYFCHLLDIQHHKQLWQWLWMSLAILAPRELKISLLTASVKSDYGSSVCLEHVSYHPSVTGSMASGRCSHHFGIWGVASWETPLEINTQQGMHYGLRA